MIEVEVESSLKRAKKKESIGIRDLYLLEVASEQSILSFARYTAPEGSVSHWELEV